MKITVDAANVTRHGAYFIGARSRLATMTAVDFISKDLLVATHFLGQKMFLIHFDLAANKWEVLQSLDTTANGVPCSTDLLEYDGTDRILTSNLEQRNVTLYRIENRRVYVEETISAKGMNPELVHGVGFIPWDPTLFCMSTTSGDLNNLIVNITTQELVYAWNDGKWVPKDICFAQDHQAIIVSTESYPSRNATDAKRLLRSKIQLIRVKPDWTGHKVLSEVSIVNSQLDSCVFNNGRIYVTDQLRDQILVLRLSNSKLRHNYSIKGFNFPHGIAVETANYLMAVTNYGDSCVELRNI